MHMFEHTSQVIARQREDEIVRAAEQRRVALERLAQGVPAPRRRAAATDRQSRPAARLRASVRALRRALRAPRPVSAARGTMAR